MCVCVCVCVCWLADRLSSPSLLSPHIAIGKVTADGELPVDLAEEEKVHNLLMQEMDKAGACV